MYLQCRACSLAADLNGYLISCAPVNNSLDNVLQSREGFNKSRELQSSYKDNGTGCMVDDILYGILSKRVVQGDAVDCLAIACLHMQS